MFRYARCGCLAVSRWSSLIGLFRLRIFVVGFVLLVFLNGCKSADDQLIEQTLRDDATTFSNTMLEHSLDPNQSHSELTRSFEDAVIQREQTIELLKKSISDLQNERLKDVILLLRLENEIITAFKDSFNYEQQSFLSLSLNQKTLVDKFGEIILVEKRLQRVITPTTNILKDKIEASYKENLSRALLLKLEELLATDTLDFKKTLESLEGASYQVFDTSLSDSIKERNERIDDLEMVKELDPKIEKIIQLLTLENKALSLLKNFGIAEKSYHEAPDSMTWAEFEAKAVENLNQFKNGLLQLESLILLEKQFHPESVFESKRRIFDNATAVLAVWAGEHD